MDYELCKKLKDSGFPQKIKAGDKYFNLVGHPRMGIPVQQAIHTTFIDTPSNLVGREDFVKIPTLSELIEACEDNFLSLEKTEKEWESCGKYFCCAEHGEGRKFGIGSTPEIAVARLWLELNKI